MKNPLTTAFPQRFRRRIPRALEAMKEMEIEMDRWLKQGLPSFEWPEEYEALDFVPSCNFRDLGKEYVLQFDLPGLKKDDVKIEIENNRVTVSGERKEKKEEKDSRHFLSETYVGTFMRSFHLPTPVDENKIDASYEDGVLTIKATKMETSKIKEVKVH